MSTRVEASKHLLFACAVMVAILALKILFGTAMGFGAADTDRFAAQGFGYEIDPSVPPPFLTWSRGDGQAFFALAADPLVDGPASALPPSAAFRYGRIGYALATRVLAFGRVQLIPYALTAVNVLAMGWIAFYASRLADTWGSRMLLLVANPGIVASALTDASEPLGMAAAVAALSSLSAGRVTGAAVILGITRPSLGTVLPAAKQWKWATGAALAAMVALQIWIRFGLSLENDPTAGNITIPITGYIQAAGRWSLFDLIVVVAYASAAVLLVFRALSSRYTGHYRLACATTGLSVLSLASIVVDKGLNIMRVGSGLVLLIIIPPIALNALRDQPTDSL